MPPPSPLRHDLIWLTKKAQLDITQATDSNRRPVYVGLNVQDGPNQSALVQVGLSFGWRRWQAQKTGVRLGAMRWTTQLRAGQLSLFPTGSLAPCRQHHDHRQGMYRVWLSTPQWRCRRTAALERGGYRCTNCGSEAALVAHHERYDHVRDEWPDDLRVLCWDCHTREHERRAV